MNFTDFLNWIIDENERVSPYQLLVACPFTEDSEILNYELIAPYFAIFSKSRPTECRNFLQYHFDNYEADKADFIWFIENTFIQENYYSNVYGVDKYDIGSLLKAPIMKVINTWIEEKRIELNIGMTEQEVNKIKWKGPPSVFGYLFLELVHNGFIEAPPLHNGEINYSGLARLFFEHFDIETTLGNLSKEMNPGKNSLSNTKRAKFTIPDKSVLA